MLTRLIVSFIMILAVSFSVYFLASKKAPKPKRNPQHISLYACGEKVLFRRPIINVTFYRYIAYFLNLDSSVIIAAFASLSLSSVVLPYLVIYLCVILTAVLLMTAEDARDVPD
jgi:NADH:ubiquinone oxidoreductase subunit 3 (subunit A)